MAGRPRITDRPFGEHSASSAGSDAGPNGPERRSGQRGRGLPAHRVRAARGARPGRIRQVDPDDQVRPGPAGGPRAARPGSGDLQHRLLGPHGRRTAGLADRPAAARPPASHPPGLRRVDAGHRAGRRGSRASGPGRVRRDRGRSAEYGPGGAQRHLAPARPDQPARRVRRGRPGGRCPAGLGRRSRTDRSHLRRPRRLPAPDSPAGPPRRRWEPGGLDPVLDRLRARESGAATPWPGS